MTRPRPPSPRGPGAANAAVELLTTHQGSAVVGCAAIDRGMMGAPPCPPGQDPRVDFVEVHAAGAQVCFARGTFWTSGECPTSPTGPA